MIICPGLTITESKLFFLMDFGNYFIIHSVISKEVWLWVIVNANSVMNVTYGIC